MSTITLEIRDIPHGHGLSLKRGIADGLLDCNEHQDLPHTTHAASYRRGVEVGRALKAQIAPLVKD